MVAEYNTYADISAFVNAIFEDAMLVARENNLATGLVTVFNDRAGMAARKNQEYGSATINAIGETDDLTSQAFTPVALSTLTPQEFGAQFLLTDQRMESDPFGVRADAAQELGAAMAAKMDQDVFGNFTALTGGTVGASGTTITWGHVAAMVTRLKAQFAPMPYYLVLHPYQWHSLFKAASIAASTSIAQSPEFTNSVMRNFYAGTVMGGLNIFVTANVPVSGTDAYCAVFARPALALDIRRAPRLEPERDASRRAWELNMTAIYAEGVWRPKFGIQGIFDASAPSS